MKSIKNLISLGYLLMALLVIGIMYIWRKEWYELEKLEVQNRHIDTFRQESHEIFVLLIELSLSGETVLEWEYTDLEHYHYQRMAMDSMLCRFKTIYPTERIDSVRHFLEDKERQMRQIVQVFERQQAINDKITRQVPIIVQKSVQEQLQKPKRKGFLGIFGKKEKPKPTVTTTMLRSLGRDMIAEQRAQSRRLSEHTDSLAARNVELNRQLHGFIRQMNKKVQADLQKREAEITAMREQSFMQIGSLTGFVLLLLVISYIIIHRNANRIKRYKQKTTDLIGQLQQSVEQNEDLEKAVNEKRFRQDLLYRLHDFEITVPPLRDCQEDVMPLAEFFREIANRELECDVIGFDGEARKTLLTHAWPGNVRELRQKIMGAVLQAQTGLVTKEHLELAVTRATSPVSFALRSDAEDKERVLRALKQANGNRKVAAELLGIGRTTLYNKLEEYGLKYKFQQS